MDNEGDSFRPLPPKLYQPVDLKLRIPTDAIAATHRLLKRAGRRESGLFWYGPRNQGGDGTVAYVVAPRQRMSWGNYHIAPEDLAQIVHQLPDDWKPLAQVHSHPGWSVEHSPYDDRMVSSYRVLSIVFPRYGRDRGSFPNHVGIHEWQDDYWHLLDLPSAQQRVILIDGTIRVEDLR
jgi:hypothetical protein